jgi:hypothetical protein
MHYTDGQIEEQYEDKLWYTVDFRVEFDVEPYVKETWSQPAEGGGPFDVSITVLKIMRTGWDGIDVELDINERGPAMKRWIERDYWPAVLNAIEHADTQEDDGDAAYDRWKDEQAERRASGRHDD